MRLDIPKQVLPKVRRTAKSTTNKEVTLIDRCNFVGMAQMYCDESQTAMKS